MKRYLLLIFLLMCSPVHAGTITAHTVYSTTGQVTAATLNGNVNAILSETNAGLDNDNADTANGYRFVEVKGSEPAAGTEGRVIYLTTEDTLKFDNGSEWVSVVTPSTAAAQGNVIYYNGTAWINLAVGTSGQYLQTKGAAANPVWADISDLTIASEADGDLLQYDGSNWVRLADGTANQYLESDGAGALTWVADVQVLNYGTSLTTGAAVHQKDLKIAYGTTGSLGSDAQASITNLPFTSNATYTCTTVIDTATAGTDGATSCSRTNGNTMVITHQGGTATAVMWQAIGY